MFEGLKRKLSPKKEMILSVKGNSDITKSLQEAINKNHGKIIIPEGSYTVSKTILLVSDTHICGADDHSTKLVFADATNSNMFMNVDGAMGNSNITVENLWIDGNATKQFRPKEEKKLSFCNIFYLRKSSKIYLSNIKATNCKQTAMHFNNCLGVRIKKLHADGMGWSGISTSGTDDIQATDVYIHDSGKDIIHSAVHYDGGVGSYFSGVIEKCTGNGVMLDSKFSTFNKSVVEAECTDCKRGVSLSGDHHNLLSNVLIQNTKTKGCEVGVLVSNSKSVFVTGSNIKNSSEYGILLQGKYGGCDTVISDTFFEANKEDIGEIHSSENNYFVQNNVDTQSRYIIEQELLEQKKKGYLDKYRGACSVCGEHSDFIYYEKSVRESYRCQSCGASLRHRGQAKAIVESYGKNIDSIKELSQQEAFKNLAIYEPGIIGPLRKYFNEFPNYMQSYYWDDIPLGATKDGVQNQNLEALSYDDSSIDLIITADIFEHIRKPWIAFEDIHRVLKIGGKHIFTIPVQYPIPNKTTYRVDTSTDKDVHILPEHYHIAGDGGKSLVYTEFGADMLEKLNAMGLKTEYVFIDDTNDLRKKNITFVSTKSTAV